MGDVASKLDPPSPALTRNTLWGDQMEEQAPTREPGACRLSGLVNRGSEGQRKERALRI